MLLCFLLTALLRRPVFRNVFCVLIRDHLLRLLSSGNRPPLHLRTKGRVTVLFLLLRLLLYRSLLCLRLGYKPLIVLHCFLPGLLNLRLTLGRLSDHILNRVDHTEKLIELGMSDSGSHGHQNDG
ncbi:hypothetical protein B0G74_2210 [Paraburkholderia sp. BL9I2N2]|nr:hypothetical protein B0G74_2210 [Paraburkholderia sp. BL9I2N2]